MSHKKKVVLDKMYSYAWKDSDGNRWSGFGTVFEMENIRLHGGKIVGKPRLVE